MFFSHRCRIGHRDKRLCEEDKDSTRNFLLNRYYSVDNVGCDDSKKVDERDENVQMVFIEYHGKKFLVKTLKNSFRYGLI